MPSMVQTGQIHVKMWTRPSVMYDSVIFLINIFCFCLIVNLSQRHLLLLFSQNARLPFSPLQTGTSRPLFLTGHGLHCSCCESPERSRP